MKENILIEGTNWNINSVCSLDKTESDFLKRHISDIGTYPQFIGDKKASTLKLVWKLCNPESIAKS